MQKTIERTRKEFVKLVVGQARSAVEVEAGIIYRAGCPSRSCSAVVHHYPIPRVNSFYTIFRIKTRGIRGLAHFPCFKANFSKHRVKSHIQKLSRSILSPGLTMEKQQIPGLTTTGQKHMWGVPEPVVSKIWLWTAGVQLHETFSIDGVHTISKKFYATILQCSTSFQGRPG